MFILFGSCSKIDFGSLICFKFQNDCFLTNFPATYLIWMINVL